MKLPILDMGCMKFLPYSRVITWQEMMAMQQMQGVPLCSQYYVVMV